VEELKIEGLTTRRGHHRQGERFRPKDRSGAKTSTVSTMSAMSEYSVDEDEESVQSKLERQQEQ
jgi:hypothetical protein